VQYDHAGNRLVLASALTGKPIDGTTPIPLGDSYNYSFTPDGKALAVVSAAKLYLISLPSWAVQTVDIDLHGWLSSMVYSPDGSLLALASNSPDAALRIVDTRTGQIRASAQAGFAVHNVHFTADGKALMLYGPHLAEKGPEANLGVSVGAPQAALLSTSELKQLWSVKLGAVHDGAFPKPGATDLYQLGAASHFSPGVAFAPNADVLYLVHGDADRLTTVDFARRSVSTLSVKVKTSWLEQLLGLTAGVAYAKGMDGTTKQAVVSPDGALLYVVGTTEAVSKREGTDEWDFKMTHVGLQVIAVNDGALLQTLDTQADMAVLAPDKQHLLLLGWPQDSGHPWTEVYDLKSMKMTDRFSSTRLLPARRADGVPVLQSSVMVSDSRCNMTSVDPASWSKIAGWTGGSCTDWLMDP
jgi:hypothetical protein